ncbi:MAG: hypothetical protein GY761_01220 [Hyphomicrobiales bacterium]|nr:hypothetical protein [Hyphomicrobiales bacterium]
MLQISLFGQERIVARCSASSKVRIDADKLIWRIPKAEEGRFFALAGLCWDFFVARETRAEIPSRQQTRKPDK